MRIVDAHAHFFSRPFFDTLAGLSPRAGTPSEKLAALARETGIALPDPDARAHAQRWLEQLDAAGVERMAAFASVPQEVPAVQAAVAAHPDRLVGVALVDPRAAGVEQRVAEWLSGGAFRGILTFPAMHHFRIGAPELSPLLRALARERAVLYLHCGLLVVKLRDRLGIPRAYDLAYANPLDVVPAADAFPEVSFVLPHFGAGFFREALMAGSQCENVLVDTSSTNSWMRTQAPRIDLREVFARALEVFGPRRILFGTDSNVFPAGWRRERLEEQRGLLEELGAPPEDRAAILGGNADRLFGPPRAVRLT